MIHTFITYILVCVRKAASSDITQTKNNSHQQQYWIIMDNQSLSLRSSWTCFLHHRQVNTKAAG